MLFVGRVPLRWGLLGTARINDRIIEAVSRSQRSLITSLAVRPWEGQLASRDAGRRVPMQSHGESRTPGDYARLPSFRYLRAR